MLLNGDTTKYFFKNLEYINHFLCKCYDISCKISQGQQQLHDDILRQQEKELHDELHTPTEGLKLWPSNLSPMMLSSMPRSNGRQSRLYFQQYLVDFFQAILQFSIQLPHKLIKRRLGNSSHLYNVIYLLNEMLTFISEQFEIAFSQHSHSNNQDGLMGEEKVLYHRMTLTDLMLTRFENIAFLLDKGKGEKGVWLPSDRFFEHHRDFAMIPVRDPYITDSDDEDSVGAFLDDDNDSVEIEEASETSSSSSSSSSSDDDDASEEGNVTGEEEVQEEEEDEDDDEEATEEADNDEDQGSSTPDDDSDDSQRHDDQKQQVEDTNERGDNANNIDCHEDSDNSVDSESGSECPPMPSGTIQKYFEDRIDIHFILMEMKEMKCQFHKSCQQGMEKALSTRCFRLQLMIKNIQEGLRVRHRSEGFVLSILKNVRNKPWTNAEARREGSEHLLSLADDIVEQNKQFTACFPSVYGVLLILSKELENLDQSHSESFSKLLSFMKHYCFWMEMFLEVLMFRVYFDCMFAYPRMWLLMSLLL
jgi:hypothetical protein